jgi:hypothetical protein
MAVREHQRRPATGRTIMPVSLKAVLTNWAALTALWALPYLTLLEYFRVDAARSEVLQWSLLIVGAFGIGSVLSAAWKDTRDPRWRAEHGLPPHPRSNASAR